MIANDKLKPHVTSGTEISRSGASSALLSVRHACSPKELVISAELTKISASMGRSAILLCKTANVYHTPILLKIQPIHLFSHNGCAFFKEYKYCILPFGSARSADAMWVNWISANDSQTVSTLNSSYGLHNKKRIVLSAEHSHMKRLYSASYKSFCRHGLVTQRCSSVTIFTIAAVLTGLLCKLWFVQPFGSTSLSWISTEHQDQMGELGYVHLLNQTQKNTGQIFQWSEILFSKNSYQPSVFEETNP